MCHIAQLEHAYGKVYRECIMVLALGTSDIRTQENNCIPEPQPAGHKSANAVNQDCLATRVMLSGKRKSDRGRAAVVTNCMEMNCNLRSDY